MVKKCKKTQSHDHNFKADFGNNLLTIWYQMDDIKCMLYEAIQ